MQAKAEIMDPNPMDELMRGAVVTLNGYHQFIRRLCRGRAHTDEVRDLANQLSADLKLSPKRFIELLDALGGGDDLPRFVRSIKTAWYQRFIAAYPHENLLMKMIRNTREEDAGALMRAFEILRMFNKEERHAILLYIPRGKTIFHYAHKSNPEFLLALIQYLLKHDFDLLIELLQYSMDLFTATEHQAYGGIVDALLQCNVGDLDRIATKERLLLSHLYAGLSTHKYPDERIKNHFNLIKRFGPSHHQNSLLNMNTVFNSK